MPSSAVVAAAEQALREGQTDVARRQFEAVLRAGGIELPFPASQPEEIGALGRTLLQLARAEHLDAKPEAALRALRAARRCAEHLGSAELLASALGGFAIVYSHLGQYDEALAHHFEALELRRAAGDQASFAATLHNIGLTYGRLHDHDHARIYHQQALDTARHLGNRRLEAFSLSYLGLTVLAQGGVEEAVRWQQEAVEVAASLGEPDEILLAECQDNLGAALLDAKRVHEALQVLWRALQHRRAKGARLGEAYTLAHLGRAYFQLDQPEKSVGLLREALSLVDESHADELARGAHAQLAEVLERVGDLAGALTHLKAALRLERAAYTARLNEQARAATLRLDFARAEQAAVLERDRREAFERMALEDSLTGLGNRRHFDEVLARFAAPGSGSPKTWCVALLDVDHFKHVNDTYSHQVGDRVLHAIAEVLRASCRTGDVLARYGGEEFALLLPGADVAAGSQVCERIREGVQQYPWSGLVPGLGVTVSVGVVEGGAATPAEVLAEADARLYAAKRAGRNRVQAQPGAFLAQD